MTTLSKRATPRQARVMRIIAGAVRNAAHAHPAWNIDPRAAGSIAKRAAGTLTAAWPDVLALPKVASEMSRVAINTAPLAEGGQVTIRQPRGALQSPQRAPLAYLHGAIGAKAAEAKRAGDAVRLAALRDVLRIIGKMRVNGP